MTVTTGHGVAQAAALLILNIAPWNESDTYRLPLASNSMALGAGAEFEPKMIVSELPSGLPVTRMPGVPMAGRKPTFTTGVALSNPAAILWILAGPAPLRLPALAM